MLLNLHVKNVALIDDVELDLREGLNILTGETGAGKSLIIDAVNDLRALLTISVRLAGCPVMIPVIARAKGNKKRERVGRA